MPLREIVRQLRSGIPSTRYTHGYFLSESCDGFNEFQASRGLSYVKQQLVARIAPAPGERILEIGPGRGEVLRACADRGATSAGIDYAADAVALTRDICVSRVKVEIDPDVLRAGRSQYTETLASNPLVRMAARLSSRGPLLRILGNDLWVAAVKDAAEPSAQRTLPW